MTMINWYPCTEQHSLKTHRSGDRKYISSRFRVHSLNFLTTKLYLTKHTQNKGGTFHELKTNPRKEYQQTWIDSLDVRTQTLATFKQKLPLFGAKNAHILSTEIVLTVLASEQFLKEDCEFLGTYDVQGLTSCYLALPQYEGKAFSFFYSPLKQFFLNHCQYCHEAGKVWTLKKLIPDTSSENTPGAKLITILIIELSVCPTT